jgi:hypothetical protein
MRSLLAPATIALLLSGGLPGSVTAADWQGRLLADNGQTRVINTETPYLGEIEIVLEPLWRLGDDDEDLLLGVVSELLEDDAGNVYLLDSQLSEVHVIDPRGRYLHSLGRAGEGPGEFRNGSAMFWAHGNQIGVIQAWPGRVVLLRLDGSPGDTFAMPFRQDGGMQIASRGAGQAGRVVLSGSTWTGAGSQQGQQQQISYLKAFDRDGRELASFHEAAQEVRFGGWEFQEHQFADFQRRWTAAADGRVAAALDFADYRIHVWNADGSLDRIIERPDFAPVRRTGDERDLMQGMFERLTRWNPRSTFKVSDVHQTVARLMFRDDSSLWVQTSNDQWRTPAGRFTSFDVYDREGRFARRVHLQGSGDATQDGVFLGGERLYVVTDMMNALLASIGAGGADEAEPVAVLAHAFPVPPLRHGASTAAAQP